MTTRIYDCEVAPTADQCSNHEHLSQFGPDFIYADWHPQLGGYCGRAAVSPPGESNSCCEVWNWHDGDFPYDDAPPHDSHYCNPFQWIVFATTMLKMGAEHCKHEVDQEALELVIKDLEALRK